MNRLLRSVLLLVMAGFSTGSLFAQDDKPAAGDDKPISEDVQRHVEEIGDQVEAIAKDVDKDQRAQDAAAGVLKPIYQAAEYLSFPAIHWVAFALMVTGVVSFALQLVLAKLVVLMRFGFSVTEILSDALGLAISIVGLVLTTQAAAENSSFTRSPFAVLSAALVGLVVGFIFYWWGQRHEIQAVEGRRVAAVKQAPPAK
jgi:hypothetical protein